MRKISLGRLGIPNDSTDRPAYSIIPSGASGQEVVTGYMIKGTRSTFGMLISKLRYATKATQRELWEKAGLARDYISRLEATRDMRLNVSFLEKLEKAFGLTEGTLFEYALYAGYGFRIPNLYKVSKPIANIIRRGTVNHSKLPKKEFKQMELPITPEKAVPKKTPTVKFAGKYEVLESRLLVTEGWTLEERGPDDWILTDTGDRSNPDAVEIEMLRDDVEALAALFAKVGE